MNDNTAKVHGRHGNYALVQLLGRSYPGLLVQGDSLKQVGDIADELAELREQGRDGEFDEALNEIVEVIKGLTYSYESMMREAQLSLPY
ncbi:DUF6959 family protein [Amycolatopsis sp. cmx-8-4]|uniref:DUF6959 family protein n=1 Tax=Amycolatopsis sp. cmx-8-4 TaxID=2790947 RepID=UPI00397DAEF4